MRRGIGRLRAGGGGGFSPSSIAFTTGLWLDQSDLSTAFQDSAGTTPVTTTGQQVGKRSDKSGNGLHLLQSTAAARPEYDLITGLSSDFTDGVNDGYAVTFAAATLGSNMDCFITLKRDSAANMVICSNGSPNFFGVMAAGDPSVAAGGAVGAAWTYWVNGVQVGGTATTTRAQLDTAVGNGTPKVIEVHNLDLSAWTGFTVGLYTSFLLNADMYQLVLLPAQSTAVRNQLRTYCGAKGGIVL